MFTLLAIAAALPFLATDAKHHHHHHKGCAHHPHLVLKWNPHLESQRTPDIDSSEELPTEFDWRNINGQSFVSRNLNQHIPKYCGSCWAHAATSTYSDRLKIMRNATWPEIQLSVQFTLNCLTAAGTCNGGSDLMLFEQFVKHGVPDDTCESYIAEDEVCNPTNRCRNCFGPPGQGYCFAQPRYKVYKAQSYGFYKNDDVPENPDENFKLKITENTATMVKNMKHEIYNRGPISCVVDADTMFDYEAGQILDKPGKEINHVISVAGWGYDEKSETSYWIVRNSWGTYWGEYGWANIKMGVNSAFIEAFCSWVQPKWPAEEVVVHNDDERWFDARNTLDFDEESVEELAHDDSVVLAPAELAAYI